MDLDSPGDSRGEYLIEARILAVAVDIEY